MRNVFNMTTKSLWEHLRRMGKNTRHFQNGAIHTLYLWGAVYDRKNK